MIDVPDPPSQSAGQEVSSMRHSWGALMESTLGRLVVNNAGAALAGVALYGLFRGGEVATDYIDRLFQIADPASAEFFRFVLSWGGAFAGSSVWLVYTFYQILDLRTELKGGER